MSRILVLSTGDTHGAYEVAYNLTRYLYEAEHTVAMAVFHKTKTDPFIVQVADLSSMQVAKKLFGRIFRRIFPVFFKYARVATDSKYLFLANDEDKEYIKADAILEKIGFVPELIVAGMTDNFCTSNTLSQLYQKTGAKIYTWLVDMEPLTGGCHYAWDCKGYEQECKGCPAITDNTKKEMASNNLAIKHKNILKSGIRVLSGSQWVTEQAMNSFLYKSQNKVVSTNACIDTRVLNADNRSIAKRIFNIPVDAKIIFTGSWNVNDPRKGMPYFLDALNHLWNFMDVGLREKVYILVAGEHYGKKDFLSDVPFKKTHIDYIKDYRLLSLAYQASDVFVCASIEDSGPLMVSEAMACGTPVVGFRMGNVYSMVENDRNGYIAELKNSKDLANGLNKILSLSAEEFAAYSRHAVNKIESVASHHAAVKVIESLISGD